MKDKQTVFILGNPRSGTSLFRIMLNHHPEIVAPPESGFAHYWLEKYSDWKKNDVTTERLDEFLRDVINSKKFETWGVDLLRLKRIIYSNSPGNYGDLIKCVYLSYSPDFRKISVICDKNNYYIHHIKDLSKIWPQTRYIHVVRDGRDVACSYLDLQKLKTNSEYKPQLSTSISTIAEEWKRSNEALDELDSKENSYLRVKYEDIIRSPEMTLKQVCDFLKIKYSSTMLDYYQSEDQKKTEPSETLDWKRKTKEKPDVRRIGRFKLQLKKEEIKTFSNIAGKLLKKYGYE